MILNEYTIDSIMDNLLDLDIDKAPIAMGMLIGYAGEGLLRLEIINKANTSWMLLL